jgi:hypothetical protein
MNTNLTAAQEDYAIFLPATSGFFATFIGKQRYSNYVDPARIPASFTNGVESMNYLDPNALFNYKWCLYSAGHAELDLNKVAESEDMFRNRNRTNSFCLGDSGGFQVGKNVWKADWKDPTCPKAQKKREQVLAWMDALMDYGMCLDIPAWSARNPDSAVNIGIATYQDAVDATHINNEYFINNRNGNCKFLNVLQGETHEDAENWYQEMKKYCDTSIYGDRAFNGWAMGGQNMCSVSLVLKRIVALHHDNLLQQGQHDWMHFLGTSKLEWACLLTDIQRAVRKYYNPNFTISFDCASPFLATANGQIYVQNEINDRTKWIYRMLPSLDNKKYATDTRLFKDVVIQDGWFKNFASSPIMDQVQVKDICIYKPGDLNKIGKEGKTSWDSFAYAIMMGHNVWAHVNAVQEANRQYDAGLYPAMLIREKFHRYTFKELVEELFSMTDRDKQMAFIKKHDKFLTDIIGTRGLTGKRETNASTYYNKFFDEAEPVEVEEFDDQLLDDLEQSVDEH